MCGASARKAWSCFVASQLVSGMFSQRHDFEMTEGVWHTFNRSCLAHLAGLFTDMSLLSNCE
jgi:hypothetical protein